MKTCLTTLCTLLLAVAVSQAAEPLHVKLFPEGTPTKSGLEEQPEGVNDKGYYVGVSDPELLVYLDRKSTRLNSSHITRSRMPSSA